MVNHIYSEEAGETLCRYVQGDLAKAVSTPPAAASCPDCIEELEGLPEVEVERLLNPPIRAEFCQECGQGVLMMQQKGTGYCSPRCEESVAEKIDASLASCCEGCRKYGYCYNDPEDKQ